MDFDHVGWAAGAALLVLRPSEQALRLRSIGRPVSVCVGAVAAIGLAALDVPRWTLGIGVVLVIVAATAMARSRWYVTPAFTTFLVFLLLISADLGQAPGPVLGTSGETVLGVTIACVFGLLVPASGAAGRAR
jgi:uncharacterized membrane protein YccC